MKPRIFLGSSGQQAPLLGSLTVGLAGAARGADRVEAREWRLVASS